MSARASRSPIPTPSSPATCATSSGAGSPRARSPSAIRAWLIQRYGSWISYKPTAEPAAWPLWLAPLALLLVGGWLIRRRIRTEEALMGWLILLALIALSLGGAVAARRSRRAADRERGGACCSARAGYALQGQPGPARARRRRAAKRRDVFPLTEARHAFFGNFTPGGSLAVACRKRWRATARARTRSASCRMRSSAIPATRSCGSASAMRWSTMRAGSRRRPSSPTSAPRKLRPAIPAAPFFYGLALARSGDRDGALEAVARDPRQRAAGRQLAAAGRAGRGGARTRRPQRRGLSRDRLVRAGRALRRPPGGGSCRPRR